MSEYSHKGDGNVIEFEGDIIVPDTPDELGWHVDADPSRLTDDELTESIAAARSMVAFSEEPYEEDEPYSDEASAATEAETQAETEQVYQDGTVRSKDLQERLSEMDARFRFRPSTHLELNDMVSLTMQDLSRGSATFLSHIQRKQIRLNTEAEARNKELPEAERVEVDAGKPRKNVESILGRYISYAQAAKSQVGLLLNLTDMVSAQDAKRSVSASTIPVLQDWSMDGSTRAPIKAMLKADDVDAYLETDGTGTSPLKDEYKNLDEAQIKAMGDTFIASMKVGQLQDTIAQRVSEQRRRFEFWVKVLEDSKANYAATKTANAALAVLVKKPSQ